MPAPTVCVTMCTFNGSRFVRQQLESIAAQTRPPDALLVVDDASTDDTAVQVRAFAAVAPFPVHLHVNAANLGWVKNFERAVSLADADWLALCDQDDVWLPDKLQRQMDALQHGPQLDAVFTNAHITDTALGPTGRTTLSAADCRQFARCGGFATLLRYNIAQGATLLFRASYRPLVLPVPVEWSHDAWIALLIAGAGKMALIDEPLIHYRQHSDNQIGHRSAGIAELYRETRAAGLDHMRRQLVKFELARLRLASWPGVAGERLDLLDRKIAHLRVRANLPAWRAMRIGRVVGELLRGRYHRYARGLGSAARDLLA